MSVLLMLAASVQASGIHVIHAFAGGPADGVTPAGSLISDGSMLYGLTNYGGVYGKGTIFKVRPDGSGLTVLHSFRGAPSDGRLPLASLFLKDSVLYGTTDMGGAQDVGTIFKINPDGSGYHLLRSFVGGASDGSYPEGTLISDGSVLYAMTRAGGGPSDWGTVFKINLDGSGFHILHSFTGTSSDGAVPGRALLLEGSTLYGMTLVGGAEWCGTIFKVGTDGSGFNTLRKFTDSGSDGSYPAGALVSDGSVLYGMTQFGGPRGWGTVFKINFDGTGFGILHGFAGWPAGDGGQPVDTPILAGSVLYGQTAYGGAHQRGTLFDLKTDGTGYELIHAFRGGNADGSVPSGALLPRGDLFYGLTESGGHWHDGVVYILAMHDADVGLSESVDNLAPGQGDEVNLTVTIKNGGPDAATGLKVTDKFQSAAGLRPGPSSVSQGSYDLSSGVWDVGTLAMDASATLTLKARPVRRGAVWNSAAVSAMDQYDPTLGDNTASVSFMVTPSLPLSRTGQSSR